MRLICRKEEEEQGETSVDTLDPGSGQIAVEEGRDGLAGLRDLVVVVVGSRPIGISYLCNVKKKCLQGGMGGQI